MKSIAEVKKKRLIIRFIVAGVIGGVFGNFFYLMNLSGGMQEIEGIVSHCEMEVSKDNRILKYTIAVSNSALVFREDNIENGVQKLYRSACRKGMLVRIEYGDKPGIFNEQEQLYSISVLNGYEK